MNVRGVLASLWGSTQTPTYQPTTTARAVARLVELSIYSPMGGFCVSPSCVGDPHGPRAIVFRLDREGK